MSSIMNEVVRFCLHWWSHGFAYARGELLHASPVLCRRSLLQLLSRTLRPGCVRAFALRDSYRDRVLL